MLESVRKLKKRREMVNKARQGQVYILGPRMKVTVIYMSGTQIHMIKIHNVKYSFIKKIIQYIY